MNKHNLINSVALVFVLMLGLTSCDKTQLYETAVPPQLVHFNTAGSVTYIVNRDPNVNLEVGTTDVANADRQATFLITSPTGAQLGTHYNIENRTDTTGTFTFAAGATRDFLKISAVLSEYTGTGRIDTLIVSLVQPGVPVADFKNSVRIVVKECVESNIIVEDLLGDYANSTDNFFDETYTTNVSYAISTGPTSGRLKVKNILNRSTENGDNAGPWGGITLDLDWSDPNNKTVSVLQAAVPNSNGGDLFGADYEDLLAAIRQAGSQNGTFEYCNQKITLKVNFGITDGTNFGWSSTVFTVILQR
jgi:hypothetical protein